MITVQEMTMADRKREREGLLLRSAATVLSNDPGIAYQSLAERIGVSRRTLYRLAPSRLSLLQRLRQEAINATNETLARAQAAETAFIETLKSITVDFLADSDLLGFWSSNDWLKQTGMPADASDDGDMLDYRREMALLFERGQREGVIRDDISTSWMALAYDALLLAAAANLRDSANSIADARDFVLQVLLNGLSVGSA